MEDCVPVEVRAIKDPKVLKEWAKEFQPADGFEWPTYKMIKSIINKKDEDTGMFHGHPSSGWMHFKDVITSVMHRVKTRHPHPDMHNLEKMWTYILSMKPHDEAATEEVLVLRTDLTAVDSMNMQLSKDGWIDTERALRFPPMGMRSVYKYQACVAPDKQNMQIMTKLETPYYYVKVEASST